MNWGVADEPFWQSVRNLFCFCGQPELRALPGDGCGWGCECAGDGDDREGPLEQLFHARTSIKLSCRGVIFTRYPCSLHSKKKFDKIKVLKIVHNC